MFRITFLIFIAIISVSSWAEKKDSMPNPTALLTEAFHNWRAKTSETTITMTIHRPEWERHSSMKTWTQGDDNALVRFTAPAKDAGNATLKLKEGTWIFNPKLNQVIKLPTSFLSQSWMGSDFSYNDLSKAEDLLTQYDHKILDSKIDGGHKIYIIEALPKKSAPVVWGKQVVSVRDDGIFLEEKYYDQDMKLVRTMTALKISKLGDRVYPVVIVMQPEDKKDRWTKLETQTGRFDSSLPNYLFTISNLQNPRNQ